VTHCGWNSTTEAIAAGVPIVAYPAWSDQPTNAKLLVDAYGVGVRLPVPLSRDGLRRCIEEVMLGRAGSGLGVEGQGEQGGGHRRVVGQGCPGFR
jgi:UDP:flavonoid glycosyltransferase YjiC (YdhE family)